MVKIMVWSQNNQVSIPHTNIYIPCVVYIYTCKCIIHMYNIVGL